MEWTTNARDLADKHNLSLQSVMAAADWAIAGWRINNTQLKSVKELNNTGPISFSYNNVSFVVELRKWHVTGIIDTI